MTRRTYKAERHYACQVASFLTLALKSLTLPFTSLLHHTHSPYAMAGESDQSLLATDDAVTDTKTLSSAESDVVAPPLLPLLSLRR
jgi:hypothetical protein